MSTVLADTPPAAATEPGAWPNGAVPPAEPMATPAGRVCAACGSAMAPGQDWCLACGAGAPGSLGTPSWRSAAGILAAVAVLVLGAAAAGYAALSKSARRPQVVTTMVARVTPAPPSTTPATPVPPTTTPPPVTATTPPKIPLKASTPIPAVTTPVTVPKTTTPAETKTGGASGEEPQATAIVLDTNAASTYDPYNYPAANFGDPSLAIDGETSTAWTAAVDSTTAPKMAEGLLIDLKAPQKLSAFTLVTSTPGMTIQFYGANGQTVPGSITDKGWAKLTHAIVIKTKHEHITVREDKKAFRFITLWISKAPPTSTAAAPGHVSVNELELFPAP